MLKDVEKKSVKSYQQVLVETIPGAINVLCIGVLCLIGIFLVFLPLLLIEYGLVQSEFGKTAAYSLTGGLLFVLGVLLFAWLKYEDQFAEEESPNKYY